MKHTVKSLLIASVLTVPTTFATGDDNLTEAPQAAQAAHTQEVSLTGTLKVLSNEHLSNIIGLDPSCCPGRVVFILDILI